MNCIAAVSSEQKEEMRRPYVIPGGRKWGESGERRGCQMLIRY